MLLMSFLQNPVVKRRYIPKIQKHEEHIQLNVCSYLRLQYPEVIFRSDFASGLHLTPAQAIKHKRLQSGKSWPDLFIYCPRKVEGKQYAGLALELKKDGTAIFVSRGSRKGQLVSDEHIQEQYYLLKDLNRLGYYAEFAIGYDHAVQLIDWYMGKKTLENGALF